MLTDVASPGLLSAERRAFAIDWFQWRACRPSPPQSPRPVFLLLPGAAGAGKDGVYLGSG